MEDTKKFLQTTSGKVALIIAVLAVGLFIGSRGSSKKDAPVAEPETAVATTPDAPVVAETTPTPEAKTQTAPKKTAVQNPAPVAPSAPVETPQPTPVSPKQTTRIDGLANVEIVSALQDSWDADAENDGPVMQVVYMDASGHIISSDATEKMPISADVKLYAGTSVNSKTTKLVYSGHFNSNQIILGDIYPKIRIPEEQISVDPSTDWYIGSGIITIHTPEQGDFSTTCTFVVLYDK